MGLSERAYNLLRAYIGREWERIEGVGKVSAEQELNDYLNNPPTQPPAAGKKPESKTDEAYRILGLRPPATVQDLKKAYTRLSERSLPANFPEGSEERKKAAEIHLRVQEAYDILLPQIDPRLKRFRSLDIN